MTSETRKSSNTANGRHHAGSPVWTSLVFFGVGAIFLLFGLLVWFASEVLLLALAGILVAILLHDAAGSLEKRLSIPHGVSIGLVLLATIAVFAMAGWLLASQTIEQLSQLASELPKATQRLRDYLEQHPALGQVVGFLPATQEALENPSSIVDRAKGMFSGALGVLGNAAIVAFVAIYLAWQPALYSGGVLKLVPPAHRARGQAVLQELYITLSRWLRGKLVSMVAVGVATAIGLTLLDVPLGLALGLLTGLLDFIPYIGPLLAAIPAVLMAFSVSPLLALYAGALFLAIQMLEGYLLVPLVERKTVSLPPAFTILMQVLMGLAFGLAGIALATPLTAVLAVLVAMLYVEDVLDDEVSLPDK